MKTRLFIGIDPGKSGGIAFLPEHGEPWAIKMPATERDIWDEIHPIAANPDYISLALIEQVSGGGFGGSAQSGSFTFGQGYGALRMALTASGIRWDSVHPAKWQKAMGCLTGGNKNISKAKAQQLFPGMKITHAIADALLLAEHARRTSL